METTNERSWGRMLGSNRIVADAPDGLESFSDSELRLLIHAAEHDGASTKDLALALGISRPAVSMMLHWLEEEGFIHRERLLTNRRLIRVSVQPAGHLAAEALGAER